MNRNSVIGFILIGAIMIFYMVYMTPSKEEIAERQRVQDSIAQVQQSRLEAERKIQEEKTILQSKADTPVVAAYDTAATGSTEDFRDLQSRFAVFANSAEGKEQIITVETDLVTYEIDTKGGFIANATLKDYQTYDSLPLRLFNPEANKFGLSFFAQNRAIYTGDLFFRPSSETSELVVSGDANLELSMRLYADAGEGEVDTERYIEYLYNFKGNNYMYDLTINIVNMRDIVSTNASSIDLRWSADLLQQEISVDQFNGSTIYYKHFQDDVDYLSESKSDEEQIKTRLKWISFKQRFFSSTLIAKEFFDGADLTTIELE